MLFARRFGAGRGQGSQSEDFLQSTGLYHPFDPKKRTGADQDICGKECEVPRVMASFREGQIPEIRINGFALCIDKQSMNLINAQDNPARKKKCSKDRTIFSGIFSYLRTESAVVAAS